MLGLFFESFTMTIDLQLITEIKTKSEVAENHINHLVEMTRSNDFPDGLDIPSINELRYALNHVLRYLLGDVNGASDALKHINRAIYDCYETEGLYLFSHFSEFETNNSDVLMKDVFPQYLQCAKEFSLLRDFIKDTPRDNRHEYYAELETKLVKIRPYIHEIRAVKQEILKVRVTQVQLKHEKEASLKIAQDNLAIANRNLELAQKTVRIRTIALFIALGSFIAAAIAIWVRS